jgi:hypothetical protein
MAAARAIRFARFTRFSIRTLLLTTVGFAILCGLFNSRGLRMSAEAVHTLLVLAFAIPGGSYGYDVGGNGRSAAVGTCVAAVLGTLIVSAIVLIPDLCRFWS